MKHASRGWMIALLWIGTGALYVRCGYAQKERWNLSATAGGQHPYLVYAQGIARNGLFRHPGDYNRMPLYPALLATVYSEDWDRFVRRAGWFAIASSAVVLIGLGALAYLTLPRSAATAFTLFAAFGVFPSQASFVQAELLFYGCFFVAWLLLRRLLEVPSAGQGAIAGIAVGVAYLVKASALPLVILFLAVAAARCAWILPRLIADSEQPPTDAERKIAQRTLSAAAAVVVLFLLVCSPYLHAGWQRFGRLFYNVNSTFFLWCDNWSQAKEFAEKYHVEERYPDAPPERIPGPVNYWRTHSTKQIADRISYGFHTLAILAWKSAGFKYLAFTAAASGVLAFGRRRGRRSCEGDGAPPPAVGRWNSTSHGCSGRTDRTALNGWSAALTVGMIAAYGLMYAWYAQVAHGDRFVLSLYLPIMFLLLERIASSGVGRIECFGRPLSASTAWCVLLGGALLVEGAAWPARTLSRPDPAFVRFYFNESHERQRLGDWEEAEKGFRGVLRVDPTFSPARHALGWLALQTGRTKEAVDILSVAVQSVPNDADLRNSLGAALVQAGRVEEAIAELEHAVTLNPNLAVAWFNLAGSHWQRGEFEKVQRIHHHLMTLDPALAEQLEALIKHERLRQDQSSVTPLLDAEPRP